MTGTFFVLLEIIGYLEGALRRDSSSGSRGGGSRLYKQDVDGKIDLKKLCDSRSLRLSRSSSPATNKALVYGMSHAQLNMICNAVIYSVIYGCVGLH